VLTITKVKNHCSTGMTLVVYVRAFLFTSVVFFRSMRTEHLGSSQTLCASTKRALCTSHSLVYRSKCLIQQLFSYVLEFSHQTKDKSRCSELLHKVTYMWSNWSQRISRQTRGWYY